ncbi:sterol desaturase family protein [soil metagenome]
MKIIRRIFDSKGGPVLTVVFIALFIAESRRQLRKRKTSRVQRMVTNTMVAVPSFSLLRFVFLPAMVKIALKNRQWKSGVNYLYDAPSFLKTMVAFLIMDYTNYLWHVLNHKSTFLWKFHLVHHTDPDLDLSTATRFHFGELIGSVFFRGLFVLLSGATAMQVLLYEIIFEGATQFHHTNWKLPYQLEKNLNKIIVTPRMHGIHHSVIRDETDSNYSVIFSIWDRLHNTAKLNIAQSDVVTGVPGYENPEELTAAYLLKLPFTNIRKWDSLKETRDSGNYLPDKNNLGE